MPKQLKNQSYNNFIEAYGSFINRSIKKFEISRNGLTVEAYSKACLVNIDQLNELNRNQIEILDILNEYDCIIDTGAYFLNTTIFDTVELMASYIKKEFIIYINESNDKMIYNIKTKNRLLSISYKL
jgi:hypothetical protein